MQVTSSRRAKSAAIPKASELSDGVATRPPGPDLDQRSLLAALQAMRAGISRCVSPATRRGLAGKIADTFNEIVAANERMAQQLEHVGEVVGREGKTRTRVRFGLSRGAWGEMESSRSTR